MPIAHTKDNLPLNEYLVQKRKFLKIGLTELALKTKIQLKHLKKIEAGDWANLPSAAYTKGFLKKYAQIISLDEGEVCQRYEIELAELSESVGGSTNNNFFSGLVRRADFLKDLPVWKIMVAVGVVAVVSYMSWQVSVILEKPNLEISFPKEDITVSDSNLTVAGQVSLGDALSINNEPVYPEENGSFKKEIELLSGVNVLEIKAVSRFGEETKIIRRVTYISDTNTRMKTNDAN